MKWLDGDLKEPVTLANKWALSAKQGEPRYPLNEGEVPRELLIIPVVPVRYST